jgi:hypothetical protein
MKYDKDKFDYCDHPTDETMCPNCGECVECGCDCERVNVKEGDKVLFRYDSQNHILGLITGVDSDEQTITVQPLKAEADFYGIGEQEFEFSDRRWKAF